MNGRKRHIKFALELRDGEQVRSLEELREYFDIEKIIGYYQDGKLQIWLEDRFYVDEADAIRRMTGEEKNLGEMLCKIFHVEYKGKAEGYDEPETIAWRNERVGKLKQYTADKEIINNIDCVAFNQDELEEILRGENTKVVYLCQNKYIFSSKMLRKKNMKYVGVGKNVEVVLKNRDNLSLSKLNIVMENLTISDNLLRMGGNSPVNNNWKSTPFLEELIEKLFISEIAFHNMGNSRVYLPKDKALERKRDSWLGDVILPNEKLLCIMVATLSRYFGLSSLCVMHVLFTDDAVYYIRDDNRQTKKVLYSEIENVVVPVSDNFNSMEIYKKCGGIDIFPCDIGWSRAMRAFLMIVADKKYVLFEDNKRVYNMKFNSLDGKGIGDVLA